MSQQNPTVAPVSRNYNEMRERLRQLLSKKRENRCKTEKCSLPAKNASTQSSGLVQQQPNGDHKVTTNGHQENSRLSSVQSMADVDALLNFIEGKQSVKKDDKKAEKKARQKQRKLDEKLKKDREVEERQKLTEFRKKTPEVTITVVNPQKPPSRLNNHNRNLPEVSILPASSPVILTPINPPKQPAQAPKLQPSSKSSKNKKAPPQNQNQKQQQSSKKSKKQSKKVEEEPVEVLPPEPPTLLERFKTLDPTDPSLTKKERKKLRRELRKLEAEKQQLDLDQKPTQIVTIRRVMEGNSAEPTVTITLKGQTPAEDKVLYTLVNGQTKEPNDNQGKKKKKKQQMRKVEEIPVPIPVQTSCATCSAKQQLERQQQQLQLRLQQEQSLKSQKKEDAKKGGSKTEPKVLTKKERKLEKKNLENKENVVQQNVTKGKQNQQNQQNQQSQKKQKSQTNQQIKQEQPKSQNEKKKAKQQNVVQKNEQVANNNNQGSKKNKSQEKDSQKKQPDQVRGPIKQPIKSVPEVLERDKRRSFSSFSNQVNNFGDARIDIENLKLPPGITITKVDVPTKPIPIKSTPMPKPKTAPKQTAIITAMGGTATGYGGSTSGSNVIVVDTGKLKQDLMPKPVSEKDLTVTGQPRPATTGKKKKKKKKNSAQSTDCVDYSQDTARIMHNPTTNMVTIRNPAFGPPKIDPMQQQQQHLQQQQQQAIIKVSDNGMVTIRSPALQQAINAGLTPPPKPDFIVKGEVAKGAAATKVAPRNGLVDCLPTGLSDLANIQISKVANGHPIPENGINLRGTSVTLTKVKSEAEQSQDHSTATKSKKKKKRAGANAPARGDDWNLVESVFTPKDIDLEDGEMDDAERELEAFKRFCLQSVPPPRKEKVNLNIKDIVLKKKAAAVIAAN